MSKAYNKNTKVEWEWGNGTGTGKVVESFTDEVTRTIKGNEVTRKATSDEPAYLIEQEGGDQVLKSHSEIKAS